MSTLVCWAGVDTHGVSSAYIATDSRISWGDPNNQPVWDVGQKAYASPVVPLILGYVGSAFFPAHIAPRLIAYAEATLFAHDNVESVVADLLAFTSSAVSSAPRTRILKPDFEMTLCFRLPGGQFWVGTIENTESGVQATKCSLPHKSEIVHAAGSGADIVRHKLKEWRDAHSADTSRAVYAAFCDALLFENPEGQELSPGRSKDPFSEGPPQLVGLYRKWNGKYFATVWKRKLYFGGIRVESLPPETPCRNELFELASPVTLKKIDSAKKHVDQATVKKRSQLHN